MPNIVEALKNAVRTSGRKAIEFLPLSADQKVQIKFAAFALIGPLLGVRRTSPQTTAERLRNVGERYLELSESACGAPEFVPERSVSIVIPVYNQLSYTLQCLDAIKTNTDELDYEVIVVDDASSDETEATLSARDDIVYIRNEKNLGFIGSCNAGAAQATKTYVCFLNNDTAVQPYWLSALVNTFQMHPNVGLAGSKLVFPDGRLQEAGGLVWEDGNAWNWGRLQDPANPRYNYTRNADYCSGAAILIPRALFNSLGGFDPHYTPAYAEDTDIAFKIRALGLATVYQPLSQVIHFEGVTSGTDTSQGVKSYQVENLKKLAQRWAPVLPHQGRTDDAALVCDRGIVGRVLILDQITPWPDRDAGSVAQLEIIQAYRALGYKVTLVPCSNLNDMPPYTDMLASLGVESVLLPWESSLGRHLKTFGPSYDVVMIFRPVTWHAHIGKVRKYAPQAKIIFHVCDLHYLREQRELELDGTLTKKDAKRLEKLKAEELDLIADADLCTLHSPIEKEMIEAERPGTPIVIIPIIFEPQGHGKPMAEREGIVFLGGYGHPPNADAVEYYLSDVHPLVEKTLGKTVHFTAAGASPPPSLQKLEGPNVSVPGFIEDIAPLLHGARVMVAPLRFGAGVKGKILSALAHGLPVVTTSVGAEGIGDGSNMLVADDADSFAEAVAHLYSDESQWETLQEAGFGYLRENTSRNVAIRAVADALNQLGLSYLKARLPAPGSARSFPSFGSANLYTEMDALIAAGMNVLDRQGPADLALVPDCLGASVSESVASRAEALSGSSDWLPDATSVVAVIDPTDPASVEALAERVRTQLAPDAVCAVVVAPHRLLANESGYGMAKPFADETPGTIQLPYHEAFAQALQFPGRSCSWHYDTSLSGFPSLSVLRVA